MSQTAQLLEDAVEASKRAVMFDSAGKQEAAAAYFYKVSAQLLEKAAGIEQTSKSLSWLEKAREYRDRADILTEIDKSQKNRIVAQNSSKQLLARCYFLFQQGLDADEAGFKDAAVNLYTQAVEMALKQNKDPEIRSKLMIVAKQALERAEVLKGVKKS